jgi:transcriptional regulator with XRE-family HTH domain
MKKIHTNNHLQGDKLDTAFQSWAIKASIGDRLRWLMEYRDMKQTELAEIIGTTQAAISNIVTQSSRKPSAPTLLKMAAALQASADWIITGDGHPFEISTVGKRAEKDLLAAFRDMDPQAQSALLAAAKAMSNSK